MSARGRTRRILIQLHLWLGLTIGLLWALQGATGMLLVFHREIDRAVGVRGSPGAMVSLDRVAEAARAAGADRIVRLGVRDRWRDVLTADFVDADGRGRTLLVDQADARPLLVRDTDPGWPGGGATSRWLYQLHDGLLLGAPGETLTGMLGALLLVAVAAGSWIGWPRRRQWRAVFAASKWRSASQRLYGWHRAVGLLIAAALLITVPAGMWMIFQVELRPVAARLLPFAEAAPAPPPAAEAAMAVTPERAWRTALARFPEARFVRATMPTPARPAYVVRLHQAGEARSWSGTTSVTIDAVSGTVTDTYDAVAAPMGSRLADAAYAVHSGEIAGLPGRLMIAALGLSLPALYVTGLLSWLRKRRRP